MDSIIRPNFKLFWFGTKLFDEQPLNSVGVDSLSGGPFGFSILHFHWQCLSSWNCCWGMDLDIGSNRFYILILVGHPTRHLAWWGSSFGAAELLNVSLRGWLGGGLRIATRRLPFGRSRRRSFDIVAKGHRWSALVYRIVRRCHFHSKLLQYGFYSFQIQGTLPSNSIAPTFFFLKGIFRSWRSFRTSPFFQCQNLLNIE